MQFVPWQNVADWRCRGCGYCCKLYSVVLGFTEWLHLTKTFGAETTEAGLNRFFIKRCSDGSCAFLCSSNRNYFCGLQSMKPQACKIWPFKVLAEPKYGEEKQAAYLYRGSTIYVYVDTMCNGLRYGAPTWEFERVVVREFAELSLGLRQVQVNSTRSPPAEWRRI
ncbi:MAG: YkgJ family cysteine cluster protein [Candidatus Bathyarchaeota archaeon]|nr:YkgJ family cysteine cluster protein [Candidatus Bathyarchaeota archaeon]